MLTVALGGCREQSALSPYSGEAQSIALLWWVMFWGAVIIFVGVMALGLYAVFRRPERTLSSRRAQQLILGGGIAFPVVVLSALLVYAFVVGRGLEQPLDRGELTIEVIGHQFWWEVRYPDGAGATVATANEIRIPAGRPVRFEVTSGDVIHSFWVPELSGKIDMLPGTTNALLIEADEPGVYRGQCAEFCGAQHARMAFYVVAQPPEDFDSWLENERAPARSPETRAEFRGREAFLDAGCGACHTVRGTPADGTVGPDLTHLGARRSLGAGILDNHSGTIAAWIVDNQELKPGNEMPEFREFDGQTLRDVATYLESLE